MNPAIFERFKKSRILILCDSDEELAAVQPLLHAESFQCLATSSESEALDWFQTKKPVMLIVSYWEVALAEKFIRALRQSCESQGDVGPRRVLLLCRSLHAQRGHELCRAGMVHAFVVSRPITDPYGFRTALFQLLEHCALQEQVDDLRQRFDELGKAVEDLRLYTEYALDEGAAHCESAGSPTLEGWLRALREGYMARLDGLRGYREPDQPDSSSALVMVVEDEPTYRTILKTMLESSGYRVLEAVDGESAMEALRVARPNLIILDYFMPGMDGLETLKQIKSHPMLGTIPVMILTGLSDKDLVRECIRQGAVDFVVKPSNRITLLNKVQTHLK
jgi:CheY-like chemotaxis protein